MALSEEDRKKILGKVSKKKAMLDVQIPPSVVPVTPEQPVKTPPAAPPNKSKRKEKILRSQFMKDRLPPGSKYQEEWDGCFWRGTLSIPRRDGSMEVFAGEARAHFTLISKLDGKFRAWERDKQKETEST